MLDKINGYRPNFNTKSKSNIAFKGRVILPAEGKAFIQSIKNKNAKTIYISGHTSLDDDSLCSEVFLTHMLKSQGIKAKVCAKSEQLNTLFLSKHPDVHKKLRKNPNLFITVDFNDVLKIPKLLRQMFETKGQKISEYESGTFKGTNIIGIDHHIQTNRLEGDFLIDDSAKSCCGILVRLADAIGFNIGREDAKIAYCGMLSDYRKGGLVIVEDGKLIKNDALFQNKNALEVLNKVEKKLKPEDKKEVYKYLDALSRLKPKEKAFFKKLEKEMKISPNGKFAYTAIHPQDPQWAEIGMDTDASSFFMREFRMNTLSKFPQLQNVAVFYRTSPKPHGVYRISIHSKNGSAEKLITTAEKLSGTKIGGGHPERGGGKIDSIASDKTQDFVNYFIQAAQELG